MQNTIQKPMDAETYMARCFLFGEYNKQNCENSYEKLTDFQLLDMFDKDPVLLFIETLRGPQIKENGILSKKDCIRPDLENIFMHGACGRFAMTLLLLFPKGKIAKLNGSHHIVFLHCDIDGTQWVYDIRGRHKRDALGSFTILDLTHKKHLDLLSEYTDNYSSELHGPIV
jgi:hypothetical protein